MRFLTRRKFLAVAAVGGVGAAAGLACGSEGDGDSTPAATTVATTATVAAGQDAGAVGLRWFGQSMFVLTSPGGTTALLDPFNDIGYTVPPPLDVDVVTITHEHPDHNNDTLGGLSASTLRGLTADGWAEIDEVIGDIRISAVQTYHDAAQGSTLGRNAAFIIETGGLRFAHLGDLGHTLDDAQLSAIGRIDVLMVPTGGNFTIGPAEATQVTEQIRPTMVFPMHYQTERTPQLSQSADEFLDGKLVQRVGATNIRIARDALPEELTAYVLDYE